MGHTLDELRPYSYSQNDCLPHKNEWVLWCHGHANTNLNHESFIAHGINPESFRIAYTNKPMKDLRAAILSPNLSL